MIISFAWTTEAFLAGIKTVTRRDCTDEYAAKFKPGSVHDAANKNMRFGGKKIGKLKIISVKRDPILHLLEDKEYGMSEVKKEGGCWTTVEDFVDVFLERGIKNPYRIEFKKME